MVDINKFLVVSMILFSIPVASSSLLIYFFKPKSKLILGFGSGVIISYVITRILPEVYENSGSISSILVFGGLVISLIFDKMKFFKGEHFTAGELSCWQCEDPFRLDFSIALAFHYFLDGFFLGGFLLTSEKFLLALVPIIAHKFIDGFILFVSFSSQEKLRSVVRIVIVSLSNVFGTLISFLGISLFSISEIFSPVAAGILIYVAIHDFIPALNSGKDFVSFVLGSIFVIALSFLIH